MTIFAENQKDLESEIKSTQDYESFKFIKQNRKIKTNHVHKLIESLKVTNLLRFCPILVDSQKNILDGQHRLLAAKKLKLPIFYLTVPADLSFVLLNSTQKRWDSEDYFNFYIAQGNEIYSCIMDLSKKYALPINILKLITSPYCFRQCSKKNAVASGDLFLSNTPEKTEENVKTYIEFKRICKDKNIKPSYIYSSRSPVLAFTYLMESELIDMTEFLNKITTYCHTLRLVHGNIEILKMYLDIYNIRRSKNRIYAEDILQILSKKRRKLFLEHYGEVKTDLFEDIGNKNSKDF